MNSTLPDEVQWLVREYLPSMEHVDILLFLLKQDGQARSLTDVFTTVNVHPETGAARLRELVDTGLIVRNIASSGESLYRYEAPGVRQRLAVEALAQAYATRPVTLIRFVYEGAFDALKSFADAFRLRQQP